MWAKFDTFPSGSNYDVLGSPTAKNGEAFLEVNSSGNPVFGGYFQGSPSGYQRAIGDTSMVAGVWYHLVGTWSEDTDTLKIYLNGTLDGDKTLSGTTSVLRASYSYSSFLGRSYTCSSSYCFFDIVWFEFF